MLVFHGTDAVYPDIDFKTTNGKTCHLSCMYRGKTFDDCRTEDNGVVPWCYTDQYSSAWGNCLHGKMYIHLLQ